MKVSRPYLTTLTPLRGIAAILVVVFHSNLMLVPFTPFPTVNLINSGWLWVDFFFVLSGFIISYVYADDFKDQLVVATYWKYIKARFARVYPLHLITLIWCVMCAIVITHYATKLHPFFADNFDATAAFPSLFFLQTFGLYISAPLNSPSWSLSTEWWMYMIFPVIVPLFYRLNTTGKTIAALVIAALFVFVKYYLSTIHPLFPGALPTIGVINDFGIFRCLAGFLLGMLTFKIYDDGTAANLLKRSWVFVALCVGLLSAMQFGLEELLTICFFPLVILSAAHNRTAIQKAFNAAPFQRLGDWSFSIYMVHVPIMYLFWIYQIAKMPTMYEQFPPVPAGELDPVFGLTICLVIVVLTLIGACITYHYIEVPARTWLNRRFVKKELAGVL